jgi:hypothetical protein
MNFIHRGTVRFCEALSLTLSSEIGCDWPHSFRLLKGLGLDAARGIVQCKRFYLH